MLATTGTVRGRVTSVDGSPITGSDVFLSEPRTGKTFTLIAPILPTGQYSIPKVPAGRYMAYCQPGTDSGLAPQTYKAITAIGIYTGRFTTVRVENGDTTSGIDFQLQPAGNLIVSVTDGKSTPRAGASVLVLDPHNGALLLSPAVTGSDGRAVVGNVPLVTKMAVVSADQSTGVFWRTGSSLSSADLLSLIPKQTTPVTIVL